MVAEYLKGNVVGIYRRKPGGAVLDERASPGGPVEPGQRVTLSVATERADGCCYEYVQLYVLEAGEQCLGEMYHEPFDPILVGRVAKGTPFFFTPAHVQAVGDPEAPEDREWRERLERVRAEERAAGSA